MGKSRKTVARSRGRGKPAWTDETDVRVGFWSEPRARTPSEPKTKTAPEREVELPPIKAKTEAQDRYLAALRHCDQVIAVGPAGTGKTFVCGTHAADALRLKRKKIIVTRPNVPAGRSLGFFPGTLEEKIEPWALPLMNVISDRIGKSVFEIALKRGDIEIVPFEVMRGRSFGGATVILDEAQNATVEEIKMFATRIGDGSQLVINGDVDQCDLKSTSGLATMIDMVDRYALPVEVVRFGIDDVVRGGICGMWVRAFHRARL